MNRLKSAINNADTKDKCSICLEPLFFPEKNLEKRAVDEESFFEESIASVGNCMHVFHHRCIKSWLNIANTCPICRDRFYWVRLSRNVGGKRSFVRLPSALMCLGVIFKSYPVENRVNSGYHDFLNVIEEDICRCIICGSPEDEHVLLLCDRCDDAYHTYCLGMEEVPDTDFFCPTCITLSQEYLSCVPRRIPRQSVRQRARSHRRDGGGSCCCVRTCVSLSSCATTAASLVTPNIHVGSERSECLPRVSLRNNWLQGAYHEDGFQCAWNVETQGQGSRASSISLGRRTESLYNSGKTWVTPSSLLSPEEKAWEMYEVQKSGERFEKYKDNLLKDELSSSTSTSQRKYKRPLIARHEIENVASNSKRRMVNVSDDHYSTTYAKGKAKESDSNESGFLRNLLNDISKTSDCSLELKSNIQTSGKYCNKTFSIQKSEEKNNHTLDLSTSSKTKDHQENSFKSVSNMFSGIQSKKMHHISHVSTPSLTLSKSFLATFSSFSSKSDSIPTILSPGRKIAFTIKKKIEKIVSKELRLYYPEKISKDVCKLINKQVCRMIYEEVALLGEHMFDDFNDIWYSKIKTAIVHLIEDSVHI
ncbi:hypothetical protein PORY_000812 [Pneumocystis oryctolagi]|uniref:Uncharacterized protein n=1 Tax=Pneumocystis oryctolagi TaxID=42067 RepID=A0ACB7CFQ0_9ASCO|nr:hypothetical protein PORY_000812 [Pneumocystis oryctolagi]